MLEKKDLFKYFLNEVMEETMFNKKIIIITVMALVFWLTSCAVNGSRDFEGNYDASSNTIIAIENERGEVNINKWENDYIGIAGLIYNVGCNIPLGSKGIENVKISVETNDIFKMRPS